MNVKIFQAIGSEAIATLEDEINAWLRSLAADVEVIRTDTAVSAITLLASPVPQAHLIVTVWWGKK